MKHTDKPWLTRHGHEVFNDNLLSNLNNQLKIIEKKPTEKDIRNWTQQ